MLKFKLEIRKENILNFLIKGFFKKEKKKQQKQNTN